MRRARWNAQSKEIQKENTKIKSTRALNACLLRKMLHTEDKLEGGDGLLLISHVRLSRVDRRRERERNERARRWYE